MNLKNISFEVKNDVAYIGFGAGESKAKSMTVLNRETMEDIQTLVENLREKNEYQKLKGAIFFTHKDNCFIAGADINLISSLGTESEAAKGAEKGQQLLNILEDLKIPTVACVHGVCLGGGLEFALACRHLLVSDSPKTSLGLPEVKLGLIPGFGGTYRLPQRVPLHVALDLILAGKTVDGRKAYKLGIADEIYPHERMMEMAVRFFSRPKQFRKKSNFKSSITDLAQDNFITRKYVFQKARESVMSLTKGHYQAPLKILDVMEEGQGRDRESYLALESQAFGELCASEQSKNLRHVFFLMEGAKKYRGEEVSSPLPPIKRAGVIGAGIMGGGIAWLMAERNQFPLMKDMNVKALELGLKQSGDNFYKGVQRKKMSRDDMERKQHSIFTQTDFSGFQRLNLVVEAIVENMEIKKKVFAEAENFVDPSCILASNTSSLSISDMAGALKDSSRFAGLHFFNPVNKMPLVEIITHDKVAPQTVKALYEWVIAVKKTPVIVKNGPGFLVNRMLCPYLNEAAYLLEEGVSMDAIEKASLNFGMPMGPCRLMDEVGMDTLVKVGKILYEGLGERARPCKLSEKVVELGLLGKKGGKGFFTYDAKGKDTGVNEEIHKVLPTKNIAMDELKLQMRMFMPMINEACYILDEAIVSRAEDVDLGMIFGTGFPPFRGGPLKYADSKGAEFVLETLKGLQNEASETRYAPSAYLMRMVKEKRSFYPAS